MAPRRARRAPPRRAARPAPAAIPRPPRPSLPRLEEPPHSHIVCRQCGRITSVDLTDPQRELLIALADGRPDEWAVDGIAFSLTGRCGRCRGGSPP
jgi:hypothetical protein